MATTLLGPLSWGMTRDEEGYREYSIAFLVEALTTDGPKAVFDTAGLPLAGSIWNFDGDVDPWAFCHPETRVSIWQEKEGEPNTYWKVECTFSTKPLSRCQETDITDPLLEPQKVSGNFTKDKIEATKDRNGVYIKSVSHEQMSGPTVTFDDNMPAVRIEQNVAALGLATFSQMVDTVNDAPLWGLPARCVKLSNVAWERLLNGTCNFYYKRIFEFDCRYNTFDRDIQDEGTKVLRGQWVNKVWTPEAGTDKTNPKHFNRMIDTHGNYITLALNSDGNPSDGTDAVVHHVEYYGESNFLLLGIPTSF